MLILANWFNFKEDIHLDIYFSINESAIGIKREIILLTFNQYRTRNFTNNYFLLVKAINSLNF